MRKSDLEKTLLDVLDETIAAALNAANGEADPNPECKVCKEKLEFMKGRLSGGFTNFRHSVSKIWDAARMVALQDSFAGRK